MLTPDEQVVINQTKMVWESFLILPTDDTDKGVVFDCLKRINDIVMATAVRHRGIPDAEVKSRTAAPVSQESSIARVKRLNLAKIGVVGIPDTGTTPPQTNPPDAPASPEIPAPER